VRNLKEEDNGKTYNETIKHTTMTTLVLRQYVTLHFARLITNAINSVKNTVEYLCKILSALVKFSFDINI
jgi:hypothetical protein